MSDIFAAYATDTNAEENGTEIELRNGTVMMVRSENSTIVRNYVTRMVRRQRSVILREGGVLPAAMQDANDIDLCVDVLVTGWRKLRGADGTDIPYNKGVCRDLMVRLPALRREILMFARMEDTFRKQEVEAISGNSPAPSGQASVGAEA